VRNRLAWIAGGLGVAGAAAYRALRGRRAVVPATEPDPRAEELRRKLAESRDLVEERDEFESAETPVDRAEPSRDVDQRRREVHKEARAAAEEMRGGSVSEG
jgi:uncharacterized caspase-like protein